MPLSLAVRFPSPFLRRASPRFAGLRRRLLRRFHCPRQT